MVLTLAEEFEPEIIFVAIRLPGPNGIDLAKHLRALPTGAHLLLVATDLDGPRLDETGSRGLFDYHFVKPVPRAALDQILDERRRKIANLNRHAPSRFPRSTL